MRVLYWCIRSFVLALILKGNIMMFIAKDTGELVKLIQGLERSMKVEIASDVGISAATVGDLLKLPKLPRPIRLQVDQPIYPETTVKIDLST